jgi:hypothetical protein
MYQMLGRLASMMEQSVPLRPRLRSQEGQVGDRGESVNHHVGDTVLAAVIAAADRRLDGTLPWDVADAERHFGSPEKLVSILQMRWHTHLAAMVEGALDDEPLDLEAAVIDAWRRCAADMPGVRRILDAHADSPGMQIAHRKDWELLASARGLAAAEDSRVDAVGRRIEELARSSAQHRAPTTADDQDRAFGAL